jgi:hypothetical protein
LVAFVGAVIARIDAVHRHRAHHVEFSVAGADRIPLISVTHGNLYQNQKMNFSVSIYSVIYKNTLMLTDNLVIIIVIIIIALGVPVNWYLSQIGRDFC